MASPSGSANGGIIGTSNKASFGKCVVTTVTATGNHTVDSGTTLVKAFVVGGGGSGAADRGGGGGAGGVRTQYTCRCWIMCCNSCRRWRC